MSRTKGATKDRWWADAIRKVAAKPEDSDPEKRKKIEMVAHKLFAQAIEGDVSAMKEIGDRLDGRPISVQKHEGDEDAPIVHKIVREIVRPSNTDG